MAEYHSLDSDNALGGGSAQFHHHHYNTTTYPQYNHPHHQDMYSPRLPSQPAAYEDFQYTFDFDFFGGASSIPTSASNLHYPSATSPMPPPLASTSSSSAHRRPFSPGASLAPSPAPSFSLNSPPTQQHSSVDAGAQPLFNEGESSLFASFLTTMDVDNNFLFNPTLPPGLPSPPPAWPTEADERERTRLGQGVHELELNGGGRGLRAAAGGAGRERAGWTGAGAGWGRQGAHEDGEEDAEGEEEEQTLDPGAEDTKPDISFEARGRDGGAHQQPIGRRRRGQVVQEQEQEEDEEPEDDDQDADPDFEATTASNKRGAAGGRRGRATDQGGRGGSKKARVREVVDDSGGAYSTSDVDMAHSSIMPSNAVTPAPSSSNDVPTRRTSGRAGQPSSRALSASRRHSVTSSARPRASNTTSTAAPSPSPSDGSEISGSPAERKPSLSSDQKRSNHIASEQKRRNAIRFGYKDLVDLLAAGEAPSGISVSGGGATAAVAAVVEEDDGEKKRKGKGSGRGRGRKGDAGAGASKSVVLEKAASYILWLERGNTGLEKEVERVERALSAGKVR